jgi:hypothetical protein
MKQSESEPVTIVGNYDDYFDNLTLDDDMDFREEEMSFDDAYPHYPYVDFKDLVTRASTRMVKGGMVTNAIMLFEYIDEEGKIKHSVMYGKDEDLLDASMLVYHVYKKYLGGQFEDDDTENDF